MTKTVMSDVRLLAGGFFPLLPLCLLIFIDAMGFAMVAPILAAHPLSASRSIQAIIYGAAIGIYPLATFFAAPILGTLSDQAGRLPVMLICGAGLATSYAAIAAGLQIESAALVILGRLVGGSTAATQAVALAALADAGAHETRDERINAGLFASSFGFVCGPVLSGALAGVGPALGQIAPLLAVILLTLVTLVWLPASFPASRRTRGGAGIRGAFDLLKSARELGATFASPALRRLALIFLLQQLGWGSFFFFVAPFLFSRFVFTASDVSYFMAVIGVGFCLSFALAMPALRRFFSPRAIGIFGMLITTACIVISAVAQEPLVEWLLAVPVATAVAFGYGALITLFTHEADGNEGEILGVTASVNALAFGVTSLAGGVISGADAIAPIIAAAMLMGVATYLLMINPSRKVNALQ